MKTKVGSLADDPGRGRRFAIAIPSAIAITAAFVVLARIQPPEPAALERAPAMTVVFERRMPTPRPVPRPTPRPTPRTPQPTPAPLPKATRAQVPQRAGKPIAHRIAGGAHAARRALAQLAPPKTFALPAAPGGSGASIAAGSGSGIGSGNATGPGNGDAGNGTGNGTDAVNASAPCGVPELIPFEAPEHNGSITYEHIRATVTYSDGQTESAEFPYRWSYRDPADDPWSPRNMNDPNFITRVQLPPDGADVSRFPDVIRYILDHTRRETGKTTLQDCPKQR